MKKKSPSTRSVATAIAFLLTLIPCAALPAQDADGTAPGEYVSPWSLGLALNIAIQSPFSNFGGIMAAPQVRITNEFRFGGEEVKDSVLTLDLVLDSLQGLFTEVGVEWERKDGRELKSPFGFYAGAGYGIEGIALRAGCRWKPFEGRRRAKNGETLIASILSPCLGANFAFGQGEGGSLTSGAFASVDLIAGSFGMAPAKRIKNVGASSARAAESPPPPLAFLVETGIHSLPLMYFAIIPFPFTEWSLGLEFGGKETSSSIVFRVNAPMIVFDFFECLSLEYYFMRLKQGNWRPGVSLGLMLSNLLIYLTSGLGVPWASTIFIGLDLLAFDFEPNLGPPIRLSFVPLYSHYLDITRPHVLTLMRLAWKF